MMQTNKMQIMDDMMRNLRRGDGLSNLQALQQMRQMKQPQPQTMTYMAKGGFPDLSGDGQITQKDILIGRGVIEKRYGGLTGLPEIRAFSGFNPFKAVAKGVKNVGKGIAGGVRDVGKGISGALGGDSGGFLKNLAIQLALTYVMGPGGFNFATPQTALGRFGMRFGQGYAGAALSKGIPGITKNPFDQGKLTSGLVRAGLGAVTDQFGTPINTPEADLTSSATDEAMKETLTESGTTAVTDAATEEAIKDVAQKNILERGKDAIMNFASKDVPGIGTTATGESALRYADVAKAGATAAAETEKQRQFDLAEKMEQDARGAAERLTNQMEAEKRSAAEFARLAMEDPVLYNYVYKYADNPQTVVDIVNRMAMGADSLEDAQQFQTATYTTESGRKPGELTAAYGGGISTIVNNAIGQNKQFASGIVPNTVDPRSDGMSDSETMIITDKTGQDPKGIMKISEEEYVISAPDMAILGNGSARAGAKKLDNFRKGLRQMAYGTSTHQPKIDSNKALQSLMRG
jgi:hypothetical protein